MVFQLLLLTCGYARQAISSLLGLRARAGSPGLLERDQAERLKRLIQAARRRTVQRGRADNLQLEAVSPGRLRWVPRAAPPLPSTRGALVRPYAVARCDLDPLLIRGSSPYPLPFAVGHECVAEIIDVGHAVRRFRVGQHVLVPFQISCGECSACLEGRTAHCMSVPPLSFYGFGIGGGHWGGALCDVLAVPFADGMLVELPAGLDASAVAAAADNLCDGWRHVAEPLARWPGERVLVLGGQWASIGLYAAAAALALGADQVDYLDDDPSRLAKADRLGARPRHRYEKPPAARIVVDATGRAKGLRRALGMVAPEGWCSSAGGIYRAPTVLPTLSMYARGATLHLGLTHTRSLLPDVLAAVRDGRIATDRLPHETVEWESADQHLLDPVPKLVVKRAPLRAAGPAV